VDFALRNPQIFSSASWVSTMQGEVNDTKFPESWLSDREVWHNEIRLMETALAGDSAAGRAPFL